MRLGICTSFVGIVWLTGIAACSGGDGAPGEMSVGPADLGDNPATNGTAGQPGAGSGSGGSTASTTIVSIDGFNRPPGMSIGRDGAAAEEPASGGAPPGASGAPSGDDLAIPVFDTPPPPPPPCSGCVELNVDVNDINQRDDFVFDAGGVVVTRVVWTLLVSFNSDQLFIQPFVDNNFGIFTELDANDFALDTPVEVVHEYVGAANTVGLSVGSSGAWTGNMTMAVFVDSVALEGGDPALSPTFDSGVDGLTTGTNLHNPNIVYHP